MIREVLRQFQSFLSSSNFRFKDPLSAFVFSVIYPHELCEQPYGKSPRPRKRRHKLQKIFYPTGHVIKL